MFQCERDKQITFPRVMKLTALSLSLVLELHAGIARWNGSKDRAFFYCVSHPYLRKTYKQNTGVTNDKNVGKS